MSGAPVQLDWLADASFARVVSHAPEPRARHTDPSTSHAAAKRAAAFVGDHETRILTAITKAGPHGACSKEIARRSGLSHVQVDRRLSGMHERGLILRRIEKDSDDVRRIVKREGCAVWVMA